MDLYISAVKHLMKLILCKYVLLAFINRVFKIVTPEQFCAIEKKCGPIFLSIGAKSQI